MNANEGTSRQVPVAVVGISAILPGSNAPDGFWRDVLAGRDLISDVPPTHWLVEDYYDPDPTAPDKTYGRRGAFLAPVDFDPDAYGVPAGDLAATDTAQLLALVAAERVLDDATLHGALDLDRDRVGVVLGTGGQQLMHEMAARLQRPVWLKALREEGVEESQAQAVCERIADHYPRWREATHPGLLGSVVAGRIAGRFDLHGVNCVTDAACSSSLAALSTAIDELALGKADMMIAGGIDAMNDILTFMCFSKTAALSPTGDCRPFSDAADGTMLGEGLVMFALERLEDAERDGRRIYAVIRGLGASADGRGGGPDAPVPEGQARALWRAYAAAGYGPETVELVEAHGTGTKAGDQAELAALRTVFEADGPPERRWCALGSVKSQIGHTKAAAGAAGLLKAVLALRHAVLPPTVKVERPNPALELDKSAFYINTLARPWVHDPAVPRRAGVSSFGVGGSTFHVTLEEYRPGPDAGAAPAARLRSVPTELVLVGAPSAAALASRCRELVSRTEPLWVLAWESQCTHGPSGSGSAGSEGAGAAATPVCEAPYRLAVVARDTPDLARQLGQAVAAIERVPDVPFSTPTGVHYAPGTAPVGGVALVFSGQGSQYVGMGADLAMHLPQAQAVWDATAGLYFGKRTLHEVVFPEPVFTETERDAQAVRLTATEWAQPALAVQSVAMLAVLRELGVRADCLAGHSFGELVALYAAGAFDAEGLVQLARRRGELMRDAAVRPGAMLAVSAPLPDVEALLGRFSGDGVWVANHNGPAQVVLSGTLEAVTRLQGELDVQGVSARRLAVSTAFHTPMLAPAAGPLLEFLHEMDVKAPGVDVYRNLDARPYRADADDVRTGLAAQIGGPVRFIDDIEAIYARGVRTFVEVGAGCGITDLVGQILAGRQHTAVSLDRKGRNGVNSLHDALGQLTVAGIRLDFEPLWAPYAPPRADAGPARPRSPMKITGANYGRPYPPPGGAAELPPPNPPRPEPVTAPQPAAPAAPPAAAAEVAPAAAAAQPASQPARQDAGWLRVFHAVQEQTAHAHAAYQQAMAASHAAFMSMAETAFAGLAGLSADGGSRIPAPTLPTPPAHPAPTAAEPTAPRELESRRAQPPASGSAGSSGSGSGSAASGSPAPVSVPGSAAPAQPSASPVPVPVPGGSAAARPAARPAPPAPPASPRQPADGPAHPASSAPPSPDAARAPFAAPEPAPASAGSRDLDLHDLLIAVVAERTGCPPEMVDADLGLESDLGIDSIGRIEVLSALRRRAPALPQLGPAEVGALRTVGQFIDSLRAAAGGDAVTTVAAPDAAAGALAVGWQAAPNGHPVGVGDGGVAEDAEKAPDAGDPAGRPGPDQQPPPVPLARLAVRAVPAPAPGYLMPGVGDFHLLVTDDGSDVAARVAAGLARHGVHASVVAEVTDRAEGIVFLGGLRPVASAEQAVRVNREAFRAARAVAAGMREKGGLFVTVQDTGGSFGADGADAPRAWLGGIAALARTAAREWPLASVKAIDCECAGRDPESLAAALVRELVEGGSTLDVGLRADGTRLTLEPVPVPAQARADAPAATPAEPDRRTGLGPESLIVVSGGGRRATAAVMIALARRYRPRLVLLGGAPLRDEPAQVRRALDPASLLRVLTELARREGRTPDPDRLDAEASEILAGREVRATLAALERAGASARYVPVDVRDAPALTEALAGIRRGWGPITGIVHGAGVPADGLIADQTDDVRYDRVFGTKVDGLRALLAATAGDPLTLLAVFGSIGAEIGDAGRSSHAMADAVVGQVASAEAVRRPDCRVRAIAWGPWQAATGPDPTTPPSIPAEAGAAAFLAELESADERPTRVIIGATGDAGVLTVGGEHRSFWVRVGPADSHLADHGPAGAPVVPIAVAMEWLARAVRRERSSAATMVLRDVRILKPISLDSFPDTDRRLLVSSRLDSSAAGRRLGLELRGEDGTVYCLASADVGPLRGTAWAVWTPPTDLKSLERKRLYDGRVLFHGPRFQSINVLDGVSASGSAAWLAGLHELGWAHEDWQTDPAAVDGGLQVAMLWAERVLGGPSLPQAVGEYRLWKRGPATGSVHCLVCPREVRDDGAVCDVGYFDEDDSLRAELFGVELVRRPVQPAGVALRPPAAS
jgi:acyl transferase domain-containing protein